MTVQPLRIGIAGLGFGAAIHVPVFRAMPGVAVTAVFASSREKGWQFAEPHDVPGIYTDLTEFLDSGLDAVSVALPPRANGIAAQAAIERGLPVLCEKPIADKVDQARRLADLACERRVANAVDFQFAELEPFIAIRDIVALEMLGGLRDGRIIWRVCSYAHRHGKWSWKTDAYQGGGVLSLLGSHLFYLVEWIFGPIGRLMAALDATETRKFTPAGCHAAEDRANLTLTLCSGASIEVELANGSREPPLHAWKISGDTSTAVLENTTSAYMSGFSLSTTPGDIAAWDTTKTDDSRLQPFRRLAGRFVAAIRGSGLEMRPNFRDGARVQELIAAARISDECRRPVDVASVVCHQEPPTS